MRTIIWVRRYPPWRKRHPGARRARCPLIFGELIWDRSSRKSKNSRQCDIETQPELPQALAIVTLVDLMDNNSAAALANYRKIQARSPQIAQSVKAMAVYPKVDRLKFCLIKSVSDFPACGRSLLVNTPIANMRCNTLTLLTPYKFCLSVKACALRYFYNNRLSGLQAFRKPHAAHRADHGSC